MIPNCNLLCPCCAGRLTYFDTVKRKLWTKHRKKQIVYIPRYRCPACRTVHRVLPENVVPYQRYEAELIRGVLEGLITVETLGYEDYPCEATMRRWLNRFG